MEIIRGSYCCPSFILKHPIRGHLTDLSAHGVKIDDELWSTMLAEIDSNNDGEISFKEFE